jgi:hypothetical protein
MGEHSVVQACLKMDAKKCHGTSMRQVSRASGINIWLLDGCHVFGFQRASDSLLLSTVLLVLTWVVCILLDSKSQLVF